MQCLPGGRPVPDRCGNNRSAEKRAGLAGDRSSGERAGKNAAARVQIQGFSLCAGLHQRRRAGGRAGRASPCPADRMGPRHGHLVDTQDPRPARKRLHHGRQNRSVVYGGKLV